MWKHLKINIKRIGYLDKNRDSRRVKENPTYEELLAENLAVKAKIAALKANERLLEMRIAYLERMLYFTDAQKSHPQLAAQAVKWIQLLYTLEENLKAEVATYERIAKERQATELTT